MGRKYIIVMTVAASLLFASIAPVGTARATGVGINDAFGDSTAAGLGLAPLPNATSADNQCGRSSQSYSALATAQDGGINQNFACSGDVTSDVYAQITQALSKPRPQFATLTIGANDINYSQLVDDCMYEANCGGVATQNQFNASLATFKANLLPLIQSINTQLDPQQILVTGYYKLFGIDTSCGAAYGITPSEAATINGWFTTLGSTIATVTKSVPNATYVAINFNGLGICTATNGPIQTPSDPAWGHPTLIGSQIIANTALKLVN